MTENFGQETAEVDELDVEGHGLREVALGLGAATAIASGAGATAIVLDNPLPGTTSGARAAAAGVQQDVVDRVAWAQRTTERPVSVATSAAGGAVEDATALADATTATALDAVGDVQVVATGIVRDPLGSTDRAVDATIATARQARDGALSTARGTADAAADLAATTAKSVQGTAQRTVAEGAQLATSTVEEAQATADPRVGLSTSDGVSVTAGAAGASVTVTAG